MQRFERGYMDALEHENQEWMVRRMVKRMLGPLYDEAAYEAIRAEECNSDVYINDQYQVTVRYVKVPPWPDMVYLSIKRRDRKPVRNWEDLQEIKNQLVGPENEAVELYPAQSRLMNVCDKYHLWVLAYPGMRFPIGFGNEPGRQIFQEEEA